MTNPDETQGNPVNQPANGDEQPSGLYGLFVFVLAAVAILLLAMYTPLGKYFQAEYIKGIADTLGVWGPTVIIAAGILTPVLMLPRWPVAFAGGLIYGIVMGTVYAVVGSALGSLLQFIMARNFLARFCQRITGKHRLISRFFSAGRSFTAVFLLRVFPFTSCTATNLLAGAARMRMSTFFTATLLGMIPSTLMYASWGKLLKKPSAYNYTLAILIMLVLVGGTMLARRHMNRLGEWLAKRRNEN